MSPARTADWLLDGQGSCPVDAWAFELDQPLADLRLARETGTTLAADLAGGLSLISRSGELIAVTQREAPIRRLAFAETGVAACGLVGPKSLVWLDHELQEVWSRDFKDPIAGMAISPHGTHAVVGFANGVNWILGSDRKKVAEFKTNRPLPHFAFQTGEATLIGAAEHGLIGRFRLDGSTMWTQPLWSNVGDLALVADGKSICLTSFNQGIQLLDAVGQSLGSFVVEGTPALVCSTFGAKLIVVVTLEQHLFCLDTHGDLRWLVQTPEPVIRTALFPVGNALICGFASGQILRLDLLSL